MKFCKACNFQCEDGDLFCPKCGEFIGNMSTRETRDNAVRDDFYNRDSYFDESYSRVDDLYLDEDWDKTVLVNHPKPDHYGTSSYTDYNEPEFDIYDEKNDFDKTVKIRKSPAYNSNHGYTESIYPARNSSYRNSTDNRFNEKKRKSKAPLIIILIIAIVVLLGAAGYLVCVKGVLSGVIKATSVTIENEATEFIGIGEEIQIKSKVSPIFAGPQVIYNSSNPSVASIDEDGNVTGISFGETTITVQSKDNNASAYCIIKVTYSDVAKLDNRETYIEAIEWAVKNEITKVDSESFGADNQCTRKMYAIMLYRFAGSPQITGDIKFTDVSEDNNGFKAICWVGEKKIASGNENNEFLPDSGVTRQQAMVMLYRFAGRPEVSGQLTYTDVTTNTDSDIYKGILWAVQKGIISGSGDGSKFNPSEVCSRKDIVLYLYRYSNLR